MVVELVGSSGQHLDLFASIAWSIWVRRNKLRVGEDSFPVQKIPGFDSQNLLEFQSKKKKKKPLGSCPRVTRVKCSPPVPNGFKTNFDGAMFHDTDEVDIGVVVRNCKGEVLAAFSKKIPMPASVLVLEMLAARRAVQFVLEDGFCHSSFEGDSKIVVKAINQCSIPHP
ncbi:hypothetical protein SO802_022894 [Lithocarpus litseifolius]|uniref:RNase H type-1 domain-containing protein n=1 Tax=Lithocarpus litseifolius TaxID=425828 RepID=A0AAW2C669_9ROSI